MTTLVSDALPVDVLGADLGSAPAGAAVPDAGAAPGQGGVDAQVAADKAKADQQAAIDAAAGSRVTTTTTDTSGGVPTSADPTAQKILDAAKSLLGVEYSWGGESATGVDCSGLVALAYKAAGITLPRVSYQQANSGINVGRDLSKLRAGDLIAWDNSPRNPGADHIAIYLGDGQIIEAAAPGTTVHVRTLGKNEDYWGVRMGWS